jgi:hypothetical protein
LCPDRLRIALPTCLASDYILPMALRRCLSELLFVALGLFLALPTGTAQIVGYIPEFHPRYKHIVTLPGVALDVAGHDILYRGVDDVITSFNLGSKATTAHYTNSLGSPPAFLTPGGILLLSDQSLQIDGAEHIPLGQHASSFRDFRDHIIDGRFGIFSAPAGLFLRDFAARTNCLLTTAPAFTDVAPNGSVVFTAPIDETNKAIRWFQNGETTTLAVSPSYEFPFVATDGTNVLWTEHHAPFGQQYPFGSVFLKTSSAERIEIATNTALFSYQSVRGEMPRFPAAAIKNGWVVFPRGSHTQMTLWRRAPDGSTTQLSTLPASVAAMGDDGSALIFDGSIYYAPATGSPKRISGGFALANYFSVGNKYYAYGQSAGYLGLGTAVYEVETEQDPFAILFPAYDAQAQIFSFSLFPGAIGDYELQRTADFVTWTAVATLTATDTYPFDVQVTTSPGYFRLHKL